MSGWSFPQTNFIVFSHTRTPVEEEGNVISEGIVRLQAEPEKWAGLRYQSNMIDWPEQQQKWTLVNRECGFTPKPDDEGSWTWVEAKFTALPPATFNDSVTDTQELGQYQGEVLEYKRPGRGEGIADLPGLKLFGDIDPDDIIQGQVGDCWMISAISALAEFDGEVQSLFNPKQLSQEGKYSIRLFDLPSQQFKNIVIDDRLACKNGSLMSCKPTADDEIWPLLLEKAFVVHAGGWDKVDGGNSTTALAVLTGCMDTFTVRNSNFGSGGEPAFQKLVSQFDKFEENNCHCPSGNQLWGGTFANGKQEIGKEELFDLLCDWDEKNYVVCAGTGAGSDSNNTDGIVDGHAYSVISAKKQVCGKFDMLLFRNPHGATEFTGGWRDGGAQWAENPDVKQALGHKEDPNDGLFWMDKEDAFKYFGTFFVCCKSMRGDKDPEHQDRGIKMRSIVLKREEPKVVVQSMQSNAAPGCFDCPLCPSEPPPRPAPIQAEMNKSSAVAIPAQAQMPSAPAPPAPNTAAPPPPPPPPPAPMPFGAPSPFFAQPMGMGGMPMGMGGMPMGMGGMPMGMRMGGFPGMPPMMPGGMPNQFPGMAQGPQPPMFGGMPGFTSPYF